MADHLLILTDTEARLLGSLYSLGAMAVLALQNGEDEEKLFQESRRLLMDTLRLANDKAGQQQLRDKILGVIDEMGRDAQEQQHDA